MQPCVRAVTVSSYRELQIHYWPAPPRPQRQAAIFHRGGWHCSLPLAAALALVGVMTAAAAATAMMVMRRRRMDDGDREAGLAKVLFGETALGSVHI